MTAQTTNLSSTFKKETIGQTEIKRFSFETDPWNLYANNVLILSLSQLVFTLRRIRENLIFNVEWSFSANAQTSYSPTGHDGKLKPPNNFPLFFKIGSMQFSSVLFEGIGGDELRCGQINQRIEIANQRIDVFDFDEAALIEITIPRIIWHKC